MTPRRPKLRVRVYPALDSFCGEGGVAMGLFAARSARGSRFQITGVDKSKERLERYPFESVCGDAIEFILNEGSRFAFGTGSPTCTGYSRGTAAIPDRFDRYDRLIPATRAAFLEAGIPYMIENVADARPELLSPIMLCGRMFNLSAVDDDGTILTLDRHRMFESSLPLMQPEHVPHGWVSNRRQGVQVAGSYGGARRDKVEAREERKGGYVPKSLDVQRRLLGTTWMTETGCKLSIPPAYTEFLGGQILDLLDQQYDEQEK